MNNIEIEKLIMTRLLTYPDLDKTRVQRVNVNFATPSTGMWIKIVIVGGGNFISGLADTPCTRETGVFYIMIYNRENNGTGTQKAYADNLGKHFAYYQSNQLQLMTPSLVDVGFDPSVNAYQMNVVIPYVYN